MEASLGFPLSKNKAHEVYQQLYEQKMRKQFENQLEIDIKKSKRPRNSIGFVCRETVKLVTEVVGQVLERY